MARILSTFGNVLWTLEKRMYVLLSWGGVFCKCQLDQVDLKHPCWVYVFHQLLKVVCEGSSPHSLAIGQEEMESPGKLILKAIGIWLQNFHRAGGNRDSWRAQTLCAPGTRGEEQWCHRDWARPACECRRVSCRSVGQWWPASGTGALAAAVLGGVCWWTLWRVH